MLSMAEIKLMNKTLIFMMLTASVASASLFAETESPQRSMDGLELAEKNSRSSIYIDPSVDWSVYNKILLDQASVAFRKNWQRDQNRYPTMLKVRDSDMEKIRTDLSELFNEVFTQELTSNGDYEMASEIGSNVLRISPQIVDLDVYAPDVPTPGIQRNFTDSAGRMTLQLEFYDSMTGKLIATLSDRRDAPYRGYYQWTTSVSNRFDARMMLQRWGKEVLERLDEARISPEL
jgi:hypothetical protein